MKKLIHRCTSLTLAVLLHVALNAQDSKPPAFWTNPNTSDFTAIQTATEGWYENRDKGKGSGYKQWKRWEDFNQDRLTPDGQITNHTARNMNALERYNQLHEPRNRSVTLDTWSQWGENNYVNGTYAGGAFPVHTGTGVLNCVAFHPTDSNTLFVGGPATGLWKTSDHGTTWTNLTDGWVNVGISSIVIHPSNPDTMYIMTGDGDGANTYSVGIWKTIDGGSIWFPTSLTWSVSDKHRGFKLAMDPLSPDVIYAATSEGLYRTGDGFNFSQEESGWFYDVVINPVLSAFVYASTATSVYRSIDGGLNWNVELVIANSERVQIAVSLQNFQVVYAIGGGFFNWGPGLEGFPGMYKSEDSGTSWFLQSITPAICSYNTPGNPFGEQVPYDIDLAVSPTDLSKVFVGAINLYGSTDSAKTWSALAMWDANPATNMYVHADIHGLEFNPLNGNLYCVSDGGIYVSTNDGATFTDLTPGMQINQFFDFAGTPQNSNYMVAGLYHNGSREYTGGSTAPQVGGGDGTGCMIDHSNAQTIYFSVQGGKLLRSTNGGFSYTTVKPGAGGPFNTDFEMHPSNADTIYAGWKNDTVYYSYNRGNTWSFALLPGGGCGSNCQVTDVSSASNGTTMYASTRDAVFKSTNSGVSWTHLFSFLFDPTYTSVTPHPTSPDLAIITAGGYADGHKVWLMNGATETNISYDLPNVPVHCSVIKVTGGIDEIYVGTDIGVFKKSMIETSWTLFSDGMPNTIVKDLEIYQNASILRAATFGRGLWETDVTCTDVLVLDESNDPNNGTPGYQYNQAGSILLSTRKVTGVSGDVTYKAGAAVYLNNGFLATEGNTVIIGTAPCGQEIN